MEELYNEKNIQKMDADYVAHTYSRFDLAIKSGKGSELYSYDGKRYIDFGSGIAVNTFGISDDIWKEAVIAQLGAVQHTSNLYYTAPQARLAQLLCEKTGMSKVFFSNSGAEANECAIKAARKYSDDRYGMGRHTIVAMKNGFHGRTITTLSATGQDYFHQHFHPFTPGFVFVEPGNIPQLEQAVRENNCCAIMMEMIQGEGGVLPLPRDFVTRAAELAQENDLLIVVDEVQTGCGRTGKFFCHEHYGIHPDIVSMAKGLAGGLPLGATLFGAKTADTMGPGDHGSTFGGNPVCAAGAVSVLQRIDDALMTEVTAKSQMIFSALEGAPGVKSLSGMGLMIGIEPDGKSASQVAGECLSKGLMVLTAKSKVRLLPALNIPVPILEEGLKILKEVLQG